TRYTFPVVWPSAPYGRVTSATTMSASAMRRIVKRPTSWSARAPRAPRSASKLVGEMNEVACDEVPVLLRLEVLALPGTVLLGTRDEAGAETDPARGGEVAVVGGDQGDLGRLEAEEVHGAEVTLGLRLVVTRHLGAQNRVPRHPRTLGHVDHEGDVTVR